MIMYDYLVVGSGLYGAIFAHENMGYYALVSTFDCIVKLLIAYGLGRTGNDNLV